jgi:hypothetical protein
MNPFSYSRADDVPTAVREVAADGAAKFIAGGRILNPNKRTCIRTVEQYQNLVIGSGEAGNSGVESGEDGPENRRGRTSLILSGHPTMSEGRHTGP